MNGPKTVSGAPVSTVEATLGAEVLGTSSSADRIKGLPLLTADSARRILFDTQAFKGDKGLEILVKLINNAITEGKSLKTAALLLGDARADVERLLQTRLRDVPEEKRRGFAYVDINGRGQGVLRLGENTLLYLADKFSKTPQFQPYLLLLQDTLSDKSAEEARKRSHVAPVQITPGTAALYLRNSSADNQKFEGWLSTPINAALRDGCRLDAVSITCTEAEKKALEKLIEKYEGDKNDLVLFSKEQKKIGPNGKQTSFFTVSLGKEILKFIGEKLSGRAGFAGLFPAQND